MFQPYCYNNDSKNSMAESKEARDQEMNSYMGTFKTNDLQGSCRS